MKKQTVLILEYIESRTIIYCGIFDDPDNAFGAAMLEMDSCMGETYHFSSIEPLEIEAGYTFKAIDEEDETRNIQALIMDAVNDDERNEMKR